MDIELYNEETYSDKILTIKKELLLNKKILNSAGKEENIQDYTRRMYKHPNEFEYSAICDELISELRMHSAIVYHNTRVRNINTIRKYGLLECGSKEYLEMLEEVIGEENISEENRKWIMCRVNEQIRSKTNCATERVSFYFTLKGSGEYDKHYNYFGGEIFYDAVKVKKELNWITRIGSPCIVKIELPVNEMNEYVQESMAYFIIEGWICTELQRTDEIQINVCGNTSKRISKEHVIDILSVD